MGDVSTIILLLSLLVLSLLSAYFSSSETALMKLNPFRLRHLVRERHRGARKANQLLRRQDRLLGVILIGNNLVNNGAALIAGVVCVRWFDDAGYAVAWVSWTIIVLVFAEVAPKTIAAERPETIAFPSSYILIPLLKLFSPVVWMVNFCGKIVVEPWLSRTKKSSDELSEAELRTVVLDSGASIPKKRQDMLLAILDLQKATVNDIMVQRSEIVGIDISEPSESIVDNILHAQHTRLPIFHENINDIIGILHLRRSIRFMREDEFVLEDLLKQTASPYFIPHGTALSTQLLNFQATKNRMGLVVDEYGEIQGIATIDDILEEIVGDFTTDATSDMKGFQSEKDGSAILMGSMLIREINHEFNWNLPTDGPRTLNGLLLEHLESIPESNVSIRIGNYIFETLAVSENVVKSLRIIPLPKQQKQNSLEDNTDELET